MAQTGQQQERKFIAVDFRGVQPMQRERTALAVAGPLGVEVLAALDQPLPEPEELEADARPRPPQAASGVTGLVPAGARGAGGTATLLLAGYPYDLRGAAAAAALRAARQQRVRTVLSLSPVVLGGPGAPLTPADLDAVLPEVDLVCGGLAELRRATR